jgi:AsmA protein
MRIFLWALATLVAGVVLLAVAAALLFDPNNFRGRISAEVGDKIHRKLDIGEIHLSLFPTLGARVKDVKLSNAEGFGEDPMAQVGEARIGVRLLPLLLRHRAEVSSITLHDLRLNLLKHADGKSNWDDLVESEHEKEPSRKRPAPAPQPQTSGGELDRIAGIDIDNANISYVDQQAKKSYALNKFSLSTGTIASGRSFDVKLAFNAAVADPALNADVKASARLEFDRDSFDAQDIDATVDASGAGVPGGKQQLALSGAVHGDTDKGTLQLSKGRLKLANLVVNASLDGNGMDGGSRSLRLSGPLSVEPFDPRDTFKSLGMALQTADATALKQASLKGTLQVGSDGARLEGLELKLDQSTLGGSAGLAGGALRFALRLDQIDADRYLAPPAKRNPVAPSGGGKPGEGDNAPLGLDKLDGLNASGTLDIGKLKLKNLNLANVQLKLAAAKGAQKAIDLGAALYGGSLSSATRLGPGARPALGETLKLGSINAGPLLQDFMGKDYVTGTGNFSLDVTSAGNTVAELKRGLNGTTAVALQNGAVKGFNLAQIIRQADSLYRGQPLPDSGAQQTDFSTLSASGRISNGVLRSDDLNGASPLLRLSGAGQVDLANSTLDYLAKPTLVNTATGQGGKELVNLQGIIIPVRVYGSFSAPRYQLDIAEALKQQAVQKLTDKLGKGKNGDLVNTLQNLFNKKQ